MSPLAESAQIDNIRHKAVTVPGSWVVLLWMLIFFWMIVTRSTPERVCLTEGHPRPQCQRVEYIEVDPPFAPPAGMAI